MAYVTGFRPTAITVAKAPLVCVHKAKRPPWRTTRTYQALDALHRRMGAGVSLDLFRGITRFKAKINPEKVYQAWVKGEWGPVMETIPWEELKGDIGPALTKGAGALLEAGKVTIEHLPAPLKPTLRWDTHNPRIREWIASRTAANFTKLSEDSATNIQRAVTQGMNQALTPKQVGSRLRNSIGLLPRHAEAVDRYRGNLLVGGMAPQRAERMADAYADKLLDYRANMIGRTETRMATNQGQMAVWRQAADEGLVDRHTTGKRWIVDGDPCEDCEAMDGIVVPLDSFFVMPDGSPIDFPPVGVHPHCFCGMEVVYDLEPGDFDQGLNQEEEK